MISAFRCNEKVAFLGCGGRKVIPYTELGLRVRDLGFGVLHVGLCPEALIYLV